MPETFGSSQKLTAQLQSWWCFAPSARFHATCQLITCSPWIFFLVRTLVGMKWAENEKIFRCVLHCSKGLKGSFFALRSWVFFQKVCEALLQGLKEKTRKHDNCVNRVMKMSSDCNEVNSRMLLKKKGARKQRLLAFSTKCKVYHLTKKDKIKKNKPPSKKRISLTPDNRWKTVPKLKNLYIRCKSRTTHYQSLHGAE